MTDEGQIGFEQVGVAGILKGKRLIVPPNQREYAWEEEHVLNLFEDVARAIADNEKTYFLGTVVTIPQDSKLHVVDGQQRLATTALLLKAMAEYLESDEPILAEAVRSEYLFTTDRHLRELVPRLTLNRTDNDFFKALMVGEKPAPKAEKPSHKALLTANKLAREQVLKIVATYNTKDHGDVLNKWLDYLTDSANVVLLLVPDNANAYRMFETLNDRGLRVSQADLIKNYLYGRAGDRIEEVQTKWAEMRAVLEASGNEDNLIDFIRHGLMVSEGFVRSAELYDRVQGAVRSPQQVVTFVTNFVKLAGTYVAVENPEHEDWRERYPSTTEAIKILNLFNIKPMRPMVVAISSAMSKKELDGSFKLLVNLGVRLLIAASTRTGNVEMTFGNAASKIYKKEIKTRAQLAAELKSLIPGDAVFEEAFAVQRVGKGQFARYYLRTLEVAASDAGDVWSKPTDDYMDVNLEHILPKKPMGNWPTFTTEEESAYVNRLGNQALLRARDNAKSGSEGFSAKLKNFADSPYKFTEMVSQLTEWTPAAVDDRQLKMAKLAVKAWKI